MLLLLLLLSLLYEADETNIEGANRVVSRVGQYFAFTSFLPPHIQKEQLDAAPTFQLWFKQASERIWKSVIALTQLQRLTCLANVFLPPGDSIAWWLYVMTVVFGNAHLIFVPRLLKAERKIKSDDSSPQVSLTALQEWMAVNNVRVVLVDVPLFFFTVAAATASANWT